MAASGINYFQSSLDFLKELAPEISLDLFSDLQKVSSPMLNILFDIGWQVYGVVRFQSGKLVKILLSIYNFYLRTQEYKSFSSLAIGFLEMINSIFSFDHFPKALTLISKTVTRYFESLKQYFLRPEGFEKSTRDFWEMLSLHDNRTFLSIIWEMTSVTSTCMFVYEFCNANIRCDSLEAILKVLNDHLLDTKSEIRLRVEKASECVARVLDFFLLNYEHLIKGDFSQISWSLPSPVVFENDLAEFMAIYRHYEENPLYLNEINKTLSNLRDDAKDLIDKANREITKTKQGAIRSAMVRYLKDLNAIYISIVESLNPNNTKPQPMSVVLQGPAGSGKSSIATEIAKMMQIIAGRTVNENLIKTKGGDPKFEPSIINETEVILLDDFGNSTGSKISSKEVLDVVNVTREIIPKANVEEKNRHRYSNIGAIFTTNDPNIGINQIATINFDSILRRFGLVLEIRVLPEFCRPGTEVLDRNHPHFADGPKDDVYSIIIKKPIGIVPSFLVSSSKNDIDFEVVEGWKKEGISELKSAMIYLRSHLKNDWLQSKYQHETRNSVERVCTQCKLDYLVCVCNCCDTQPEAFEYFTTSNYMDNFREGLMNFKNETVRNYNSFDAWGQLWIDAFNAQLSQIMLKRYLVSLVMNTISQFYVHRYTLLFFSVLYMFCVTCFVMPRVFTLVLGILYVVSNRLPNFSDKVEVIAYLFIFFILFICNPLVAGLCAPFCGLRLYCHYQMVRLRLLEEERYLYRLDFIRRHYYSRMTFYSIMCGSGLLLLFLSFRKIFEVAFNKVSEAKRDIANDAYLPDFAPTNKDGIGRYVFFPKPSEAAITSSRSDAISYIKKKLLVVRVTTSDGTHNQEVRGIPMGSEILLPAHALPNSGLFDVTVCADYTKRTSEYRSRDLPQNAYTILRDRSGNKVDAVLLNMPNIPTQADLSRYFVKGQQPKEGPAVELYKLYGGSEVKEIDVALKTPWDGGYYRTPRDSYRNYPRYKVKSRDFSSCEGMCGSPIVSDDANAILAIHVAGNGTKEWFALRITLDMLEKARYQLMQESGRFVSHPIPPEFTVKANHLGLEFEDNVTLRAVNDIDKDLSPIEEIGYVLKDGEKYSDRAENYYFRNKNPRLVEAFGTATCRPPVSLNGTEQINSTLVKLDSPKFDVPIDLIDRAADDYMETSLGTINFDQVIATLRKERSDFYSVRTIDEATHGDNTGIVRGINNNSSAGCLYGGKKTRHYNMDVEGDPMEIRELLPHVMEDIEKQEIEWRAGRGTFDPFKRCSKSNELLPWDKAAEKTRSFYSNDMVYFINMTRVIIPLKHTLRKSMPLSECFVGVTPQSKQWRDLKSYLSKNGEYEKFICGDFSGYDTQLPKALLDKAAWILVEMARRGGMAQSDLTFLRGALSSVVSPTLFWQGHVLRMANGQPSGQPLTVEINSIVNSLLMRMTFFVVMDEEYPDIIKPVFRDYVRLATYGDDNVMGVSDKIGGFNHTNVQAIFKRWGIKYTMADKNADSTPYQDINEVSFLKRCFLNHPDLGLVGPIERDSIVKCFYYWIRAKNSPLSFPVQFREMVRNQVREAYLHGPIFYDWFCEGIKKLQEGSHEMNEEFHVKWNQVELPTYDELTLELSEAYV